MNIKHLRFYKERTVSVTMAPNISQALDILCDDGEDENDQICEAIFEAATQKVLRVVTIPLSVQPKSRYRREKP
jgi:hypothetical protein